MLSLEFPPSSLSWLSFWLYIIADQWSLGFKSANKSLESLVLIIFEGCSWDYFSVSGSWHTPRYVLLKEHTLSAQSFL